MRLDGIDVNHHSLHAEGSVACREAGKSVAVPRWNAGSVVACQSLERRISATAVVRKRAQHVVDGRAIAATMQGFGKNLAEGRIMLPASASGLGGRHQLLGCRHHDRSGSHLGRSRLGVSRLGRSVQQRCRSGLMPTVGSRDALRCNRVRIVERSRLRRCMS